VGGITADELDGLDEEDDAVCTRVLAKRTKPTTVKIATATALSHEMPCERDMACVR